MAADNPAETPLLKPLDKYVSDGWRDVAKAQRDIGNLKQDLEALSRSKRMRKPRSPSKSSGTNWGHEPNVGDSMKGDRRFDGSCFDDWR